MEVLIIGLALLLGVHMIRLIGLRGPLVRLISEPLYAVFYSVISAVGLALVIYGHILSHPSPMIWQPPEWPRTVALFAVPVSLVLLAAAYLPSHIRSWTRHPMTLAVFLWSGAHLVANGELASVVLFGSLFVWSVIILIEVYMRGGHFARPGRWSADIAAIVIGLGAAALFAYFHMQLFGVAVFELASEPRAPGI
ncbi:MAG: NnrU family protein [Oceanicaulis sp.]|nr:NnrU family protein [Oceanicaulis sp.]